MKLEAVSSQIFQTEHEKFVVSGFKSMLLKCPLFLVNLVTILSKNISTTYGANM